MDINSPLRLRPRFEQETCFTKNELVDRIKILKSKYKSKFRFTYTENHLWIYHHKSQEKIFTPNLHLEIIEDNESKTIIKGLYSPNNSYWTLFIFFHFILASLFIAFAILAYTKSILNDSYMVYLILMLIIFIIWVALYVFARINRKKGLPQAYELQVVFKEWTAESMSG